MAGNLEQETQFIEKKEQEKFEEQAMKFYLAMNDTRLKFVNVQLVAVAACLGFAITQTRNEVFTIGLVFAAMALLFWAVSFYSGCMYISFRANIYSTDMRHLRRLIFAENEVEAREIHAKYAEGKDGSYEMDLRSAVALKRQTRAFVLGAISYVVWHGIEIWRRTPENICLWV